MNTDIDQLLSPIPIALVPKYQTKEPNANIELYNGQVEVEYGGVMTLCDAIIYFDWLPTPCLRFKLTKSPAQGTTVLGKNIKILMPGKQAVLEGPVTSLPMFGGILRSDHSTDQYLASGRIVAQIPTITNDIHSVLFHIPNFIWHWGDAIRVEQGTIWTGRAFIEGQGWKVTVDQIQSASARQDALESSGGFAITNVGLLQRTDGQVFTIDSANEILEAIGRYLSFVAGRWISPILREFKGADGAVLWEDWLPYRAACHGSRQTWFNSVGHNALPQIFPGFVNRALDATWKEPFNLALYWYLESNMCAGGIEGAIILTQAALELLAYEVLVNEAGYLSEEGFNNLPASDKIRLLLANSQIPLDIPTHFTDLAALAKSYRWPDGPAGFTEIRNALVHSNPKKRARILAKPSESRFDAWQLGLWYLDMLLLHLVGYRGQYSDRRMRGVWRGEEVKNVPWVP